MIDNTPFSGVRRALEAIGWTDPCCGSNEHVWVFRDYESDEERERWLEDADATVEKVAQDFPDFVFNVNEGIGGESVYIDVWTSRGFKRGAA